MQGKTPPVRDRVKVQALNRLQIAVVWLLFGTLVAIAKKVRSMKNNETVRDIPY